MQESRILPIREIDPALPRYTSLTHMIEDVAEKVPDRTAIICDDDQLTYKQLSEAITALAKKLVELNVKGKRVTIMVPNSIETVIVFFAVLRAGATASPINAFFTLSELNTIVDLSDSSLIISTDTANEKAEQLAKDHHISNVLNIGNWIGFKDEYSGIHSTLPDLPGSNDLSLLLFTGGTTGRPKGVLQTHSSLLYSTLLHCSAWPKVFGKEILLTVTPMFHIWGLGYSVLVAMYIGASLIIVPKYDPETVLKTINDMKVTVFGGGPAPIYNGLLNHPLMKSTDFSSLKYNLSGGAPCSEHLHAEWLKLTGCPIMEGVGMTEGAPYCLNQSNEKRKLLSVGNPPPETIVEIVDVETGTKIMPVGESGEVRVKGPQFMVGYFNNPEETAKALRDGYMYTGDIGYVDEDGYLFIVDRKKEMVIVGGYNVYPREVDEILMNHEKIHEAACVAKPDERLGEVVVAYIVLNPGESMTEEAVLTYCQENMVKYKRPVDVHFMDSLPRTAANKINKLHLKALLKTA